MELVFGLLVSSGALLILCVVFRVGYKTGHNVSHRKDSARLAEMEDKLYQEETYSIELINGMERKVQEKFHETLREWWPQPDDADSAWAHAEQMANRRAMRDAGRKTLPRSDATEPGRLHQGKVAIRKDRRANPK